MATFVVGDVHGCLATLETLLDRLPFELERDRLWLVGDLVNRGPRSLEALRWARLLGERMGDRFEMVLGNHDLHLLARAAGVVERKRRDTLEELLAAPDREELLAWLRARPFVHREAGRLLVHAGLWPEWSPQEAEYLSHRLRAALADPEKERILLCRRKPRDPELQALFQALAVFARIRTCTLQGRLCDFTGHPLDAPSECIPWFHLPGRRWIGDTLVFGHWAALGFHREAGLYALDTGCVWGGALTVVRLEDGAIFQQGTVEKEEELP